MGTPMNDLARIDLCYSITFDRRSPHSPWRIWSAVTDPRQVGSEYRGCANVVMPAPYPTIPSHADLLGSAR